MPFSVVNHKIKVVHCIVVEDIYGGLPAD